MLDSSPSPRPKTSGSRLREWRLGRRPFGSAQGEQAATGARARLLRYESPHKDTTAARAATPITSGECEQR